MLKRTALIVLLALPLTQASAADSLARIESVSEDLMAVMFQAMIDEFGAQGVDTDKLQDALPDTSWDEPMRDAGRCVLDAFTAKIGEDGVDSMLDTMEARLPEIKAMGLEELDGIATLLPEGISEADASAINDQCGMSQLMQQKLMNPAFMSAVMSLMADN